jgi:predicted  nucleic acid-binding Zn-ribbon protein
MIHQKANALNTLAFCLKGRTTGMDETERLALEREVQAHLERVDQLMAHLRTLEEQLEASPEPAKKLKDDIRSLKIEIRGRMAAIAIGEARLGVDPV